MSLRDKLTRLTDIVESTTYDILPNEGEETTTVVGEFKNIWTSGIDFANSHSKVFAIIISGIVAIGLISLIIFIVKKIKCKKYCKRYYKKKR